MRRFGGELEEQRFSEGVPVHRCPVLVAFGVRQSRHDGGMDILIAWTTADGEEREEHWPSIERFRAWALAERLRCTYRAFKAADDGEWELVDEGDVKGA